MPPAKPVEDKYIRKVALRIRALRQKAGMTQDEVERYGVSYKHMQKIESGDTNPTVRTLMRLAKAFHCDIRDFIV